MCKMNLNEKEIERLLLLEVVADDMTVGFDLESTPCDVSGEEDLSSWPFPHEPVEKEAQSDDDDDDFIARFEDDEFSSDLVAGEDVDTLLANALRDLSVKEREEILMGQHGVSDQTPVFETTELLQQKLEEMQMHLERIKNKYKKHRGLLASPRRFRSALETYLLAEMQNAEYVQDRDQRLMFLRSERFDAKLAAERFIRFFELKHYCFGESKLCKDIVWQDLSDESQKLVKLGLLQVLPSRDRSNRVVVFIFPALYDGYKPEAVLAAMLYVCSKDVEVHRNGHIMVIFQTGEFNRPVNRPVLKALAPRFGNSWPTRPAAIHLCCQTSAFRLPLKVGVALMRREKRALAKLHFGTPSKCIMELAGYGIPIENVPVTPTGEIKIRNHQEWLKSRRQIEEYIEEGTLAEVIEAPTNQDVVFGKGKPFQTHIGNVRLMWWVEESLEEYNSKHDRGEKFEVIKSTVQKVKDSGGRFLTKESGIWVRVSDDLAYAKVSNLYRNRRSEHRRNAAAATTVEPGTAPSPSGSQTPKDVDHADIFPLPDSREQKRSRNN